MYDERLIEADLRLRTYSEQALKFTSLAHPNACRFKVRTCWCGRIDIASASKAYIGILCLWPYGPSSDRPSHCRCNQLLRRPIRTSRHPGISSRWWPMSSILSSPWCSACCTLQRTQRSSLSTTEHEQLLAEEHPWRCRVSPLKSALMSLCSDEWLRGSSVQDTSFQESAVQPIHAVASKTSVDHFVSAAGIEDYWGCSVVYCR